VEAADKPPIGELLAHYGAEVEDTGRTWLGVRCPFHEDRSSSASVNFQANVFRCHTCDFGGDSFALVMWQEGIRDFGSAIGFCERILGDSYTTVRKSAKGKRSRRSILDEAVWAPSEGQRNILSAGRRRRPASGS
jgi:hypothetical protein